MNKIELASGAILYHGDMREALKLLPENSIDSVVCDPPYHLTSIVKRFGGKNAAPAQHGTDGAYARASKGFMNKQWDGGDIAFQPETWAEVLRVLKPGGHVAAFGASRGYHRMACAIEGAGFEIRDSLMWVYGTGFPKSHDVSKGIDKLGPPGQAPFAEFAAHYETQRKALGFTHAKVCAAGGWYGAVNHGGSSVNWANGYGMPTVAQWAVLQPLLDLDNRWKERVEREEYEREVIGKKAATLLAVAPGQDNDRSATSLDVTLPGSDAARQWEGWGTALKPSHEPIVLARKPLSEKTVAANVLRWGTGALNIDACRVPGAKPDTTRGGGRDMEGWGMEGQGRILDDGKGRWPANVVHDGSDEVVGAFPNTAPAKAGKPRQGKNGDGYGMTHTGAEYNDNGGSAARFFYSAKASAKDRNEGLDTFTGRNEPAHRKTNLEETADNPYLRGVTVRKNTHPTVKPTALMQWLCRLITPPSGVVLDPFMGSGSTGKAAVYEGFRFIGVEREEEYIKIAEARIVHAALPVAAAVAAQPANDNIPPDSKIRDLFSDAA